MTQAFHISMETISQFNDSVLQLDALDLSRNSLTGSLPSSWGAMHNLQYANLASNKLTGTVPSSWSNWSKVRTDSVAIQLVCVRSAASATASRACRFCMLHLRTISLLAAFL